jgi:peptidoglycan/xylan/chitin deacetylase (PgdA/CDA1 family)
MTKNRREAVVLDLATDVLRTIGNAVLKPRGALFLFHRMAPAQAWAEKLDQGFHLDADFVDAFLTYLAAQGWDFVTMEEAVQRARATGPMRKFVNFSIDDCYRDTFEVAIPLFRRHNAPLTLFLTTGIPDNTFPLWAAGLEETLMMRDRVETAEGPLTLTDHASRVAAFHALFSAWDRADQAACYRQFCDLNGIDSEALHWRHAMSWEMLEAVRDDPCVEIGGHTINHPHVAWLDREAAAHEMGGGLARITQRLGIPARHFAFPFGRSGDCGPREFDLARELGLTSAATTVKGLVFAGQDPLRLPRITINGKHRNMALMEAHLTGLTALASYHKR